MIAPIRLYLDEDAMHKALVQALRARGVDVETVNDAGTAGVEDEAQLRHATAQGRALYTYNVGDFHRLHTQFLRDGEPHSGIIIGRQTSLRVGDEVRRLLKLMANRSAASMVNRLEFLSNWS